MRARSAKVRPLVVTLVAVFAASACGVTDDRGGARQALPPEDLTPEVRSLVEAAEREGALKLNWMMSSATTMAPLVEAFRQTYDLNIDITVTPTPSFPANLARLVEEHSANRPSSTDAYLGTQDYLLAGGPQGRDVFERVDWGGFSPAAHQVAVGDGIGIGLLDQIPGFAYNTQEIAEHELPRTTDDVLRLAQPIASTTYAAIFNLLSADDLLGPQAVEAHLDAFRPAGLIGCAELDRIASGEFAGLWISCGSNIAEIAAQRGAPLGSVVLTDAGLILPWYMAVPKNAAHPNAAKLWVSWLVTPQAQQILFEHEFADNRLLEGSRTAEEIAAHEARGVRFTVTDYDFVVQRPQVSDPAFLRDLARRLRGES
jgi:hypothetical protein